MVQYLIRRAVGAAAVLIGVTLVVFLLAEAAGDPVLLMLSGSTATEHDLAVLRHQLGYDAPAPVRYARFLWQAIHGDLGTSLRYHLPALPLVLDRLPATLELSVAALGLALVVAVPAGIMSAYQPNSPIDQVGRAITLIGQAVPLFWLGIMLILICSVRLHLFPAAGKGGWSHLVLPAVTLGLYPMARIARLLRSSMLEALDQDYVRTAFAKGLGARRVIFRHVFRNAALPVLTIVGLMFGTLLGGAVVTETIFSWPGVGLLSVQAIYNRDFPVVQASVFLVSLGFVLVNLAVDLAYALVDPRIRYTR
jgi:ABC-type dipeptide/oligopeptide/nickel transport system permease component